MNKLESNIPDRTVTMSITAEFLEQYAEVTPGAARERVEQAALQIERSYSAVVTVEDDSQSIRSPHTDYKIRAIAKRDANLDDIRQGLQSVRRHIAEGADD